MRYFALNAALIALTITSLIGGSTVSKFFVSSSIDTHAVTNPVASLHAEVTKRDIEIVLTDFSYGKGWIPEDRVAMVGLVDRNFLTINGGVLSGWSQYSGWVVTGDLQSPELRHLCSRVCVTSKQDSLAVFLFSGGEELESDVRTRPLFGDRGNPDAVSIFIFSSPEVSEVRASLRDQNGEVCDTVIFDAEGRFEKTEIKIVDECLPLSTAEITGR